MQQAWQEVEATGNHKHYTKQKAEFYWNLAVHYFVALPSTIIPTAAIQSWLLYFTAASEQSAWMLLSVTDKSPRQYKLPDEKVASQPFTVLFTELPGP